MKKLLISTAVLALLLGACSQTEIHFADPADVAAVSSAQNTESPDEAAEPAISEVETAESSPAEAAAYEADAEALPLNAPAEAAQEKNEAPPAALESTAESLESTASAAESNVSLSYGGIPFDLAANTETWWQIDSSDSAYWAVQENLNAIRAAGGLEALSMDDTLSAAAGARCESFVAGGPFDHSGQTTKSEICASGAIGSASEVCAAWQASANHYANIMRTDISRMGVACWFCSVDGSHYTYWTVTFE